MPKAFGADGAYLFQIPSEVAQRVTRFGWIARLLPLAQKAFQSLFGCDGALRRRIGRLDAGPPNVVGPIEQRQRGADAARVVELRVA